MKEDMTAENCAKNAEIVKNCTKLWQPRKLLENCRHHPPPLENIKLTAWGGQFPEWDVKLERQKSWAKKNCKQV